MLLSFDVADEAIAEHDDWHTHEHLQERLSIPGFLRGTRWVALRGGPRYMVLYEVASLATLTSGPYLERLNNPSPWTSKMMAHYRGMKRGLCTVTGSFGLGMGHVAVLLRFAPEPGAAQTLRAWLLADALPKAVTQPGVGSAHLLESAATPAMTNEQRIRGADAGLDWAVLLTGYREDALSGLQLDPKGARDITEACYRFDYSLTTEESVVGRFL